MYGQISIHCIYRLPLLLLLFLMCPSIKDLFRSPTRTASLSSLGSRSHGAACEHMLERDPIHNPVSPFKNVVLLRGVHVWLKSTGYDHIHEGDVSKFVLKKVS